MHNLKEHGTNYLCLVVGNGNSGMWSALANIYPESSEQRWWNCEMMNVLDKLTRKVQNQPNERLPDIVYSETREAAEVRRGIFVRLCRGEG